MKRTHARTHAKIVLSPINMYSTFFYNIGDALHHRRFALGWALLDRQRMPPKLLVAAHGTPHLCVHGGSGSIVERHVFTGAAGAHVEVPGVIGGRQMQERHAVLTRRVFAALVANLKGLT